MTTEERLAIELHKFFRAATLALARVSRSRMHDHGWSLCGQKSKKYFLKRAKLMLERSNGKHLDGTIQEMEAQLGAALIKIGVQLSDYSD